METPRPPPGFIIATLPRAQIPAFAKSVNRSVNRVAGVNHARAAAENAQDGFPLPPVIGQSERVLTALPMPRCVARPCVPMGTSAAAGPIRRPRAFTRLGSHGGTPSAREACTSCAPRNACAAWFARYPSRARLGQAEESLAGYSAAPRCFDDTTALDPSLGNIRRKEKTMKELAFVRDEDLAEKAPLYGQPAIDAERARRNGVVVNLRGEDVPPPDPWEAERTRAGHLFDPIGAAGLSAASKVFGDAHEREAIRRQQERRREKQRSQFEVALGATITLRDGTRLSEGAALTAENVDHPHAAEVLRVLVDRGLVSSIDPHIAWLNALDPSVGPFVVVAATAQVGTRTLRRGQSVSEADFPPLELPRRFSDEAPASQMTVRAPAYRRRGDRCSRAPQVVGPPAAERVSLRALFRCNRARPQLRPPRRKEDEEMTVWLLESSVMVAIEKARREATPELLAMAARWEERAAAQENAWTQPLAGHPGDGASQSDAAPGAEPTGDLGDQVVAKLRAQRSSPFVRD